jgi:hypothetical protein
MKLVCSPRSRRSFVGSAALVLGVALTSGCGGGEGTVSGKVLYNGKPLPGGVVTFRPTAGGKKTVTTPIDEGGNFKATLPVGDVQIAVDNRELQAQAAPAEIAAKINLPPAVKAKLLPAKGGAAPEGTASERPPGTYVPIPSRYYDVTNSGLTLTVKAGAQPFDIMLK